MEGRQVWGTRSATGIMVRNELGGAARSRSYKSYEGNFEAFGGFQGDGKLMNDFEEGMRFNALFKN